VIKKCSSPQQLSTESHSAWVIQKGGYFATLSYSKLILDLEDDDSTGFRPVQLVGVPSASEFLWGIDYHAEAQGYLLTAGISSKPAVKTIVKGDSFAVYNQGGELQWPRVKGMRNGHPFWYAAAVPSFIKGRRQRGQVRSWLLTWVWRVKYAGVDGSTVAH